MKESVFTVTQNSQIATLTYLMRLDGDCSDIIRPGQFVNIRIEGLFLRRPISVCDLADNRLTIIYKTVGKGTEIMAGMKPGQELSLLTGLGNGYDLSKAGDSPLLIGGGVGIPPLYYLARKLREEGKAVTALLGFNRKEEMFFENEFRELGCDVTVTTADGSCGTKGFVTDAIPAGHSYFYTCGPEPMLSAVYRATVTSGQFSFEERMGCGFGACMGCSCRTVTGYKRICKDGPVLEKEEILWED
ncbi:MAG: dihydroorotate dehydrogenase electron transfer subunit [Oscillospiraceae bacterium]|nr:dihydroorotate dehydrogenase electron transfer subunit [Oscillospiraceae bacterium]